MVLAQTYVLVPGTDNQAVLVSGAGPVLDLAEAFHDVFDAVTSTFRFVWVRPTEGSSVWARERAISRFR